jgi:hypothetical protein
MSFDEMVHYVMFHFGIKDKLQAQNIVRFVSDETFRIMNPDQD